MTSSSGSEDKSWDVFGKLRNEWKKNSTFTKACMIGGAAAVTASLLIMPTVRSVGFTPAGVAPDSFAASVQTPATARGSVFARFQSAGATGKVSTSTSLGVSLIAGAAAAGITVIVCRETPNNPKNGGNPENGNNEQAETEEEMNGEEVHDEQLAFTEESPIQASVGSVETLARTNMTYQRTNISSAQHQCI